MANKWRTIKSLVYKIWLHGRRGKGPAESFSRGKQRHAPQKEGGWEILCDLPPEWPRLVHPTNLTSRINGKKTHTQHILNEYEQPHEKQKTKKNECHWYLNITPKTATRHTTTKMRRKNWTKRSQTRDTIHMTIRGIYTVRSTDMFDLSSCTATDICVLLTTLLARACATAARPTHGLR